ncbi:MAG TPA: hypothetical protein VEN81_08905 [Planctomycetota bacterium]|nr:hypothetical protein [Planctomycetota bacterium]
MDRMSKVTWVSLAAVGLLGGCLMRESNYRNYGARPHEWDLPGPEDERKVFGPMPFEEAKAFIEDHQRSGWQLIGFELASIPESEMIDTTELDRPAAPRRAWPFDIPKTYDDRVDPPALKAVAAVGATKPTGPQVDSVPPYVSGDVKSHRQDYLVIMRRWK